MSGAALLASLSLPLALAPIALVGGALVAAVAVGVLWMILTGGAGGGADPSKARFAQGLLMGSFPAETQSDVKLLALFNFRGMLSKRREIPRPSGYRIFEILLVLLDEEVPAISLPNPDDNPPGRTLLVELKYLEALGKELARLRDEPEALVALLERVDPSSEEARRAGVLEAFEGGASAKTFAHEVGILIVALQDMVSSCLANRQSLALRYQGRLEAGTPSGEGEATREDSFDASDRAAVEPLLRVCLRANLPESSEVEWLTREDFPGFLTVLLFDRPHRAQPVRREDFQAWKAADPELEEVRLFALATENVAREAPLPEPRVVEFAGGTAQLYEAGPWISAYALDPEAFKEHQGPAGLAIALPHNSALLVAPLPEAGEGEARETYLDWLSGLNGLASELFDASDRPLRREVFLRNLQGEVALATYDE